MTKVLFVRGRYHLVQDGTFYRLKRGKDFIYTTKDLEMAKRWFNAFSRLEDEGK